MLPNGTGYHNGNANGIDWLTEEPYTPAYPPCPSDYEERPIINVTPSVPKPAWRNEFPSFTHNLSWNDPEGVSHSLTLRSDDLQALFADIKMVKSMIKRSKEKHATAHPDAPEEQAEPDTQRCEIHGVDMPRRWSKRTSGHYFGHKCSDGSFCYGKAKNGKA